MKPQRFSRADLEQMVDDTTDRLRANLRGLAGLEVACACPGSCPHCGRDQKAQRAIQVREMRFDPKGAVIWKGAPMPRLSRTQRVLLGTILASPGKIASYDSLIARMGYDASDARRQVMRVVARLRDNHPDFPIENIRGEGYRWAA